MRQLLLLFSVVFSLLLFNPGAFAQGPGQKCNAFHEGKFKLVSNVSGKNYYVTRTKKYQTEQEEGDPQQYVFKIKWIDDCTYTLVPHNVPEEFKKSWGKKDVLLVEIREVEGNKCVCYAKFKNKKESKMHITHLEKIE
jgi:hypothetical protein